MIEIGINNLMCEDNSEMKHYNEIAKRLQLIDKEIIRLIEAKRRYEEELKQIVDLQISQNDIHTNNDI